MGEKPKLKPTSEFTLKGKELNSGVSRFNEQAFSEILEGQNEKCRYVMQKIIDIFEEFDKNSIENLDKYDTQTLNTIKGNLGKQINYLVENIGVTDNLLSKIQKDGVISADVPLQPQTQHEVGTIVETTFKRIDADVINKVRNLIDSSYQIFVKQVDEQLENLTELGYDEAAKVSPVIKKRVERNKVSDKKTSAEILWKKDIKNRRKSEMTRLEKSKRKFLLSQYSLMKKHQYYDSNLRKAGTNTLIGLMLKNVQKQKNTFGETKFLKLQAGQKILNARTSLFNAFSESARTSKRIYSMIFNKRKSLKMSIEGINKAVSIMSIPLVHAIGILPSVAKGIFKLSKMGLKAIIKAPVAIFNGVKKISKFVFLQTKRIATLPINIIKKTIAFINTPFVKKLADFLTSDAGAAFLGMMTAIVEFAIIRPIIGFFPKMKMKYLNIKQKYMLERVKQKLLEWKKAGIDGQTHRMSKIDATDDELISECESIRDKIDQENRTGDGPKQSTVGFSALILLLKTDNAMKGMYNKFSDVVNTIDDNYSTCAKLFVSNKIDEMKNTLLKLQVKFGNITGDLNIENIFEGISKEALRSLESIEETVTDFGIGMSSSVIGGFIGSFFFPPLGTMLGALVGGAVGSGINWLRKKAKMRKKGIEFAMGHLTSFSESSKKDTQKYSSLKAKYGSIESLEEKRKTGTKITREQQEALDKMKFFRSKGTIDQQERTRLAELKSKCQDDINDFQKKAETGIIESFQVDLGKTGIGKNPFEGKKLPNKEILLAIKKRVGTDLLRMIDTYDSENSEFNVSFQDIVDFQKAAYDSVRQNGNLGELYDKNTRRYRSPSSKLDFDTSSLDRMKTIVSEDIHGENRDTTEKRLGEFQQFVDKNRKYVFDDPNYVRYNMKFIPINENFDEFARFKVDDRGLVISPDGSKVYSEFSLKDFDEDQKKTYLEMLNKNRIQQFSGKMNSFLENGDVRSGDLFSDSIEDQLMLRNLQLHFKSNLGWLDDKNNTVEDLLKIAKEYDARWYERKKSAIDAIKRGKIPNMQIFGRDSHYPLDEIYRTEQSTKTDMQETLRKIQERTENEKNERQMENQKRIEDGDRQVDDLIEKINSINVKYKTETNVFVVEKPKNENMQSLQDAIL